MDKEFLIGLGLNEENADLILEKSNSEISDIKIKHQLENELSKRGVKNINAAMKLFNTSELTVSETGIDNLNEKVDNFVLENDFLFGKEDVPVFSSPTKTPHDFGISRDEFLKMGYAKRLKLFNENPQMYKMLTDND